MDRRSVYSLYSTITLGVPGTPMAAFADLSDDQRWGLAFYVASLGDEEGGRRRGAAVWERGRDRGGFADLASLAMATAAEVRARHGEDAVAVLTYLRTRPDLAATPGASALVHSTRLLGESLQAYRLGRAREAQDLAVSSYLDGFELVEPSLDAVDRSLRVTIEGEMIRYRTMLREGSPISAVEAQADRLQTLLAEAQRALGGAGLGGGPRVRERVRDPAPRRARGGAGGGRNPRPARARRTPGRGARGPRGLAGRAAARRAHVGAGLLRRDDQRRDPRGHRGRDRAGGDSGADLGGVLDARQVARGALVGVSAEPAAGGARPPGHLGPGRRLVHRRLSRGLRDRALLPGPVAADGAGRPARAVGGHRERGGRAGVAVVADRAREPASAARRLLRRHVASCWPRSPSCWPARGSRRCRRRRCSSHTPSRRPACRCSASTRIGLGLVLQLALVLLVVAGFTWRTRAMRRAA